MVRGRLDSLREGGFLRRGWPRAEHSVERLHGRALDGTIAEWASMVEGCWQERRIAHCSARSATGGDSAPSFERRRRLSHGWPSRHVVTRPPLVIRAPGIYAGDEKFDGISPGGQQWADKSQKGSPTPRFGFICCYFTRNLNRFSSRLNFVKKQFYRDMPGCMELNLLLEFQITKPSL